MTAGPLPPEFQKLEARLDDIKARFQRGELSDAAYQEQIQSLTLVHADGSNWWLGGESAAWHRWDGKAWVRSDPRKATAVVPPARQATRTLRRPLLLGCGAGVLLVLGTVVILLLGGLAEYRAAPKIVEGIQPGTASDVYSLSQAQQAVVAELGAPQAFTLLFYEEELEDGSLGDVRFETWSYYAGGLEFTFINGDQIGEETLDVGASGDIVPIPYRPEQFAAYMSLDEVVDAAGLTTYLVVPLEKELVRGGEVYYADELTFGLKNDELLYIEALALQVEG